MHCSFTATSTTATVLFLSADSSAQHTNSRSSLVGAGRTTECETYRHILEVPSVRQRRCELEVRDHGDEKQNLR